MDLNQIKTLEKELAPVEGSVLTDVGLTDVTLSRVNQIYIDLMKKLARLAKQAELVAAKKKKTAEGKAAEGKAAEKVSPRSEGNPSDFDRQPLLDELSPSSSSDDSPIEDRKRPTSDGESDSEILERLLKRIAAGEVVANDDGDISGITDNEIQKQARIAISSANAKYGTHCSETYEGFHDVLETYDRYLSHGTGIGGYWRRYYHGYVYKGPQKDKQQNFIQLIDMLALMDSSGDIIKDELLPQLQQLKTPFDSENQLKFMDLFYDIFTRMQDNYVAYRTKQDENFIQQLKTGYKIKTEDEPWLRQQLKEVVYGIPSKKIARPVESEDGSVPEFGKLEFDLKQFKEAVKEQNDGFEKQVKAFKKAIHHVSQELGLPSRLSKVPKIPKMDKEAPERPEYKPYKLQSLEKSKYVVSKDQQKKRKIKARTKKAASWGAFTSSLGEGCVAGVGAASIFALSTVGAGIVMGIVIFSGWFINRLLFKGDSENCLNDLFLKEEVNGKKYRRIFLKKSPDGTYEPISNMKKALICLLGLGSLFIGFVYATLNFIDTLKVILFSNTTLAVGLGVVGASFPAVGILIGLTCIFFTVIADFIRNDRHKDIGNYIYKNFFDVPWSEMTGKERGVHVAKCVGRTLICLAAVGLTTLVTMVSFGVLYHSSLKVVQYVANANFSKAFSKAASWINSIVSFPFQVKGAQAVMLKLSGIKTNTFSKPLTEEAPQKTNLLQKQANVLSKAQTVMGSTTTFINALGQSGVNQSSHTLLSSDTGLNRIMTSTGAFVYSAGPNFTALVGTVADEKVLAVESAAKGMQQPEEQPPTSKIWRYCVPTKPLLEASSPLLKGGDGSRVPSPVSVAKPASPLIEKEEKSSLLDGGAWRVSESSIPIFA